MEQFLYHRGNIIGEYPYTAGDPLHEVYGDLQCHKNVPNCLDVKYGKCDKDNMNTLRFPSNKEVDTEKRQKIFTASTAVEAIRQLEKLHTKYTLIST